MQTLSGTCQEMIGKAGVPYPSSSLHFLRLVQDCPLPANLWDVHFTVNGCTRGFRGSEAHERVTEAHISLLLHVGLLTRHSVPDRFLFAVPNAGPIVKGIIAGRKVSTLLILPLCYKGANISALLCSTGLDTVICGFSRSGL